jgi:hypothetical protein
MKRFASIIAIAALSLPLATSVSADELDYALAYEAKIADTMEMVRKYDFKGFQAARRLEFRLNVDREYTLNLAGRLKADMCKVGDGEPLTNHLRDKFTFLKSRYAKLPATATNKLNHSADIEMLLTLTNIPCDN